MNALRSNPTKVIVLKNVIPVAQVVHAKITTAVKVEFAIHLLIVPPSNVRITKFAKVVLVEQSDAPKSFSAPKILPVIQ